MTTPRLTTTSYVRIAAAEIHPGDMLDGHRVGIPEYYRVTHVAAMPALKRPRRIATADLGGRPVRAAIARINRRVRKLARIAARADCHLTLHWGGLSHAPDAYSLRTRRLTITVWIVASHQVRHALSISDRDDWSLVDVTWRELERARAAREIEHATRAAAYLETLPPTVRRLAETARPTCLRLSADGTQVTEILHDCGGSMTGLVDEPTSLAARQTSHDAIYHPEVVR